jgi:hypothetical protein
MPIHSRSRRTTAFHEAGHVIVATLEHRRLLPKLLERWHEKIAKAEAAGRQADDGGRTSSLWGEFTGAVRLPIDGVTIEGDGAIEGRVSRACFSAELDLSAEDPKIYRTLVLGDVRVALAGWGAEVVLTGAADAVGCSADIHTAHALLDEIDTFNVEWVVTSVTADIQNAFTDPRVWGAVEAIADRLLKRGALSGVEAVGTAMVGLADLSAVEVMTIFENVSPRIDNGLKGASNGCYLYH